MVLSSIAKKRAQGRQRKVVSTLLPGILDAMNQQGVADATTMQLFSMESTAIKTLAAQLLLNGKLESTIHGTSTHGQRVNVYVHLTNEEIFAVGSLSTLMHRIVKLNVDSQRKSILVVHTGIVTKFAVDCAKEVTDDECDSTQIQFLDASKTTFDIDAAISKAVL